jgi:hypothetical protein
MTTNELTEQVRTEVKRFKEVQEQLLQTHKGLCVLNGGPDWQRHPEDVFPLVRREIIPIMEQIGMDAKAVQALCAWAERMALAH